MGKVGALISAAGLGALLGAFGVSIVAFATYLSTNDGGVVSAKIAAAISVHMLATAVMFVIACIVGSTAYWLLRRFGWANYVTTGALGLAVGLAVAPSAAMSVGGLIAALVFHWRYCSALTVQKAPD